jgi:hypothetical protein
MDLKRAWRNGFLVSVIFAIPLSDLYTNPLSNLVVDNNATEPRVVHTGSCETCAHLKDVHNADDNDKLSGVPSSWDNNVDENNLTVPGNILADLLPESGDPDSGNIQQLLVQFDPQDIFLSEPIRDFDTETSGNPRESGVASFGPYYAPGLSGPFTPAMFTGTGKSANASLQNASTDDTEIPFVDPIRDSTAETETGAPVNTAFDTTTLGTGDDSLHSVPEPSSLVLMTIGTISVATLLYRKSKTPAQFS